MKKQWNDPRTLTDSGARTLSLAEVERVELDMEYGLVMEALADARRASAHRREAHRARRLRDSGD